MLTDIHTHTANNNLNNPLAEERQNADVTQLICNGLEKKLSFLVQEHENKTA